MNCSLLNYSNNQNFSLTKVSLLHFADPGQNLDNPKMRLVEKVGKTFSSLKIHQNFWLIGRSRIGEPTEVYLPSFLDWMTYWPQLHFSFIAFCYISPKPLFCSRLEGHHWSQWCLYIFQFFSVLPCSFFDTFVGLLGQLFQIQT